MDRIEVAKLKVGDIISGEYFDGDKISPWQILSTESEITVDRAAFACHRLRVVSLTSGKVENRLLQNTQWQIPLSADVSMRQVEMAYVDGGVYYCLDFDTYEMFPVDPMALDEYFSAQLDELQEGDVLYIHIYQGQVYAVSF